MNAEASPGALSRRVDELTVVERGVKCRPIRGKLIMLTYISSLWPTWPTYNAVGAARWCLTDHIPLPTVCSPCTIA